MCINLQKYLVNALRYFAFVFITVGSLCQLCFMDCKRKTYVELSTSLTKLLITPRCHVYYAHLFSESHCRTSYCGITWICNLIKVNLKLFLTQQNRLGNTDPTQFKPTVTFFKDRQAGSFFRHIRFRIYIPFLQ